MKKAITLSLFLFFLCGLTVCLNGCKKQVAPGSASSSVPEANIASSADESIVKEAGMESSIEDNSENAASTTELIADLGGNLKVNAQVSAPDNSDLSLPIIRVQLLTMDGQKICQTLFPDAKIKDAILYPDYPDAQSFELDGEKYVTTNAGVISATTPLGEIVTQLYALEWILNDETLHQPDLSFASRDEVIHQTLAALSEMGIENVQCTEVYALSTELLQNASNDLISQPDFSTDIQENRIAFKDNWTIDDECYVLKMQFITSDYDMPVFSDDSAKAYTLTEIHYENYMAEAVVSKDGFVSLRIFKAFEEVEQAHAAAIIPVENLVDLISNYYQNIIIEHPTEIREIILNYILLPVEGKNMYELTPAWCCQAISQRDSEGEYETSWIVFDAITGQIHY